MQPIPQKLYNNITSKPTKPVHKQGFSPHDVGLTIGMSVGRFVVSIGFADGFVLCGNVSIGFADGLILCGNVVGLMEGPCDGE